MVQTLLNCIVGSRGLGNQLPGSDMNLRELVFHGPEDVVTAPTTSFTGSGTCSKWPLSAFLQKILSFNWECLEILFGDPKNFLRFDPILTPLWRARDRLVCYEMIDSLADRAEKMFKRAFKVEKQEGLNKDRTYNPNLVVHSFNLIHNLQNLLGQGLFKSQILMVGPDILDGVFRRGYNREHLCCHFRELITNLRQEQLNQIRSPSSRERNRGEGPQSNFPPILSKETRTAIIEIGEEILSKAKVGQIGKPTRGEDWKHLLRGEELRLSDHTECLSMSDYIRILNWRDGTKKS